MCLSHHHSQSSCNGHRSQSQNLRFSHKDQHELESQDQYDDSKWYSYEQESVCIQFTNKNTSTIQSKPVWCLMKLITKTCQGCWLTCMCQNVMVPMIQLLCMMLVLRFKIDSGACGNLIPLSLFLDLFPGSSVHDLKPTIGHTVQLVAHNKNLIKQYGTCYLKLKTGSNGRMHICKFYVVDSHFNPIIGVGSCLKLGLITFQNSVYTGWKDGRPVSIGTHGVDAVGVHAVDQKKTLVNGDVPAHKSNAESMGEHQKMQTGNSKENDCDVPSVLTKDWIISNPKYKHLFTGIG